MKKEQLTTEELEYFHRQIQLWGKDVQEILKEKKIAIIGSGGLGCSLAIALGSSGIGQLDLVDFDEISIHNIHRQIGFSQGEDGLLKCEVLAKHVKSRNPFVKVVSHEMDFETFSYSNDYYDLIIDATDNLPVREKIDQFAKDQNIPWLYGSVESFHGQVCFFDKASFGSVFNVSDHKPDGIAVPIVMHIASLQANIALRYLAGLEIKKDFLYYCYFDVMGEYHLQKFGLPTA
jgi:molybdopterin-synthase adenylyltransferase